MAGSQRRDTSERPSVPSVHETDASLASSLYLLTRLAAFDARQAEIIELHFFAGVTFEEIAVVLGVSPRTVKRDWSMARAWMKGELSKRT
jgi:RNA polymerase sigma factor (sigma-70 family)